MNARIAFGDIGVPAHPGHLVVQRQRGRHGLGELGAENRFRAIGDKGAIALVAAQRALAMASSRSAITACNSSTRQHAQREKGLQLVGIFERSQAPGGGPVQQ
jgi:hypothetical protein